MDEKRIRFSLNKTQANRGWMYPNPRKKRSPQWLDPLRAKKVLVIILFFDDFESFSSRLLLQHRRNDKGFY
jgi:hypothetical protein